MDSPAGVGFSYSKNETDYVTGDIKTASDSHVFLLKVVKETAGDFDVLLESANLCSHRFCFSFDKTSGLNYIPSSFPILSLLLESHMPEFMCLLLHMK